MKHQMLFMFCLDVALLAIVFWAYAFGPGVQGDRDE
jgi:hypothetical protein